MMTSSRLRPLVIFITLAATACGGGTGNTAVTELGEGRTGGRTEDRTVAPGTYELLSETGLYADIARGTLASDVDTFEPNFKLWSDGAEKARFVAIPRGQAIDTTDMDHWIFPVGTRFWKEFRVDGVGVETRMIERLGEGKDDYFMSTFVWNDEQTDAVRATEALSDVHGTAHDVPASADCHTCHDGDAGRVLGFSALQLAGPAAPRHDGITLDSLVAQKRLTTPPATTTVRPPGNDVTSAALGYLHANCGHCHSKTGSCSESELFFQLSVGDSTPEATGAWQTAVAQPARFGGVPIPAALRVAPGDPASSAVVQRMQAHGIYRMPYLGTEVIDDTGVALVSAWITWLSP